MNTHIKSSAALLLALWISGCGFLPLPEASDIPWRSEISQQGCPDVSGRYKDPEDVVFDAFYARNFKYPDRSDNRVSEYQYIEFPYYSLPWRDGYKAMLKFDLENSVNIHIDGSIVTLELFHDDILYQEQKRKLNYFMIGCSDGSYVFRSFSVARGVEFAPGVVYVVEHYIKRENDGSLIIDKYSRDWRDRDFLFSGKPKKEEHNRYILEPVREK